MQSKIQKLKYFGNSFSKNLTKRGFDCPSCGAKRSEVVDRKYLVTTLRRCNECRLLYRAPTTSAEEFDHFYQQNYSEGFTTEVPSDAELVQLKTNNFLNSGKDYTKYVELLRCLGCTSGDSVLDFGCSWGYGSWQFSNAGFDVVGYEISRDRCDFAREKLNVDAWSEISELGKYPKFKFVFTSHVLEHIPEVRNAIQRVKEIIAPGGYFLAFTPNGSESYRSINPASWASAWGFVHPLFIDCEFYKNEFSSYKYLIDSSEYDIPEIRAWSSNSKAPQGVLKTNGSELMIAVKFGS